MTRRARISFYIAAGFAIGTIISGSGSVDPYVAAMVVINAFGEDI